MAGRNSHINRFLIFISVFLCLICGLLFTQSSAGPSGNNPVSIAVKDTQIIPEITDIPDQTDQNRKFLRKPKMVSGQQTVPTGFLW